MCERQTFIVALCEHFGDNLETELVIVHDQDDHASGAETGSSVILIMLL